MVPGQRSLISVANSKCKGNKRTHAPDPLLCVNIVLSCHELGWSKSCIDVQGLLRSASEPVQNCNGIAYFTLKFKMCVRGRKRSLPVAVTKLLVVFMGLTNQGTVIPRLTSDPANEFFG